MPQRRPSRWVKTQAEVAAHFGRSRRTVADWQKLPDWPKKSRRGYDLEAIDTWRLRREAQRHPEPEAGEGEATLKWNEEWTKWRAKQARLEYERACDLWILRSQVHELLGEFAAPLRRATETIQRLFGREAWAILTEAVNEALRAVERHLGATSEEDAADPPGGPVAGGADPAAADPLDAAVGGR
jgi:transposase